MLFFICHRSDGSTEQMSWFLNVNVTISIEEKKSVA
jgi:hypothetical protein